ncbi:MAG: sigma-70 family RNA polymerase sigma factor [Candidatus Margulisiibacteriota bacterium]
MLEFSNVYEDCKANVWKLVYKYVYTQEDREDLFQEIFLNVHKALPRFRNDSAVSTWIYRIAVNTAINFVKKRDRYKTFKNIFCNFRAFEEEEADITLDVEIDCLKPLEKLNPQQRMILILAEVEEKKLEEIAETMKIPVGTVKSNLHRAREIIKKEVNKNGKL